MSSPNGVPGDTLLDAAHALASWATCNPNHAGDGVDPNNMLVPTDLVLRLRAAIKADRELRASAIAGAPATREEAPEASEPTSAPPTGYRWIQATMEEWDAVMALRASPPPANPGGKQP